MKWLLSLHPVEKHVTDPAEKLLNSMRVTSRCRYNASLRLSRNSAFSFSTTTLLSLGLILIPLLQNAGIRLAYPEKVLNVLQIFLAVAVLVYSLVNATARYEVRSEALNECGDKIKDLIRGLRRDMSTIPLSGNAVDLEKYHLRYNEVSTDTENHSRLDYLFASLEMRDDFTITGLKRLLLTFRAYASYALMHLAPIALISLEIVFILDILGITSILLRYFVAIDNISC